MPCHVLFVCTSVVAQDLLILHHQFKKFDSLLEDARSDVLAASKADKAVWARLSRVHRTTLLELRNEFEWQRAKLARVVLEQQRAREESPGSSSVEEGSPQPLFIVPSLNAARRSVPDLEPPLAPVQAASLRASPRPGRKSATPTSASRRARALALSPIALRAAGVGGDFTRPSGNPEVSRVMTPSAPVTAADVGAMANLRAGRSMRWGVEAAADAEDEGGADIDLEEGKRIDSSPPMSVAATPRAEGQVSRKRAVSADAAIVAAVPVVEPTKSETTCCARMRRNASDTIRT